MSTYKEIAGQKIKKETSNPSEPLTGQMWYNSTTRSLRGLGIVEATNSAPNMINKRSLYGFGVGTGTAGLVVGGLDDSTYLSAVEEYNGSGWAAGGTYPTARYSAGTAGTQTAAIAYGGRVPSLPGPGSPAETYNYDGSSWTSGNSFPTGGNSMQGIGTVNTAVVSTEDYSSTSMHYWNGTSWAAANARNTAKGGQAAFGAEDAAVLAGGFPSDSNITEVYDGTNWTSGNTMNNGRQQIAGSGTQTDGLAFGGDEPPTEAATTRIESWDGTSWSTSPATLATARTRAGTGRNTASGTWIAGGIGPGGGGEAFEATEEYNKSLNTITAAAWSSTGNVNTTRSQVASGGTNTAGWIAAGTTGSLTNAGEEYNGSSWTSVNAYGASLRLAQGAGPQTAAYAAGGMNANPGPPSIQNSVYEYDGTNWTSGTAYPTGIYGSGAAGTQTAGLNFGGGQPGAYSTTTKHYNGSAWTAGGAMSTGRNYPSGTGVQTAALSSQGNGPPGASTNVTEEYDGSSWTSGGTNLFTVRASGANGSQTAAIAFGGNIDPGTTVITSQYDGTAWATNPNIAQERQFMGYSKGANTVSGTWMATGEATPGNVAATEEFTATTETANIATFSTS